MKLFRIFAVGLLLSAVVVSTAMAPISNALLQDTGTQAINFSSKLFALPSISLSSFNTIIKSYTPPEASTSGPSSNPPEADVVPNFSGLVVNGPTAIDSDDDGTDDLIIDDNGKLFINNYLKVNANADDASDTNEELKLIGKDSLILGEYSSGVGIVIDNFLTQQVMIDAYDSDTGVGFFSVWSPNVRFTAGTVGDVDFEIEGNLQVDGTIQTASTIGTHYINRQYFSGTSSTATCDTGHVMTGCSGYGTSTSFRGSIPSGNTCTAYRSTSGSIYAYAHCFDAAGIVDPGTYEYP